MRRASSSSPAPDRPPRPRRAWAPVLAVLAAASGACSSEFTPRSVLTDLRVLAIAADPLEVGPDEPVTLRATTYVPPGAILAAESWRFCPFSTGSSSGYACAVDCEEDVLDRAADGAPVVNPGARALACVQRLAGATGPLPIDPAQLPARIDTVIRYTATTTDGRTQVAVLTVPLSPAGAPAVRNVPPRIVGVSIGGVVVESQGTVVDGAALPPLVRGHDLEVAVELDPASAQPYVDDAGNALTESLVVSYYTTAGRFDYDRANGPDARVNFKYESVPPGTDHADLWAVARDLRGGVAVRGPWRIALGP